MNQYLIPHLNESVKDSCIKAHIQGHLAFWKYILVKYGCKRRLRYLQTHNYQMTLANKTKLRTAHSWRFFFFKKTIIITQLWKEGASWTRMIDQVRNQTEPQVLISFKIADKEWSSYHSNFYFRYVPVVGHPYEIL